MSLELGIIGLPNVGKSTLFNALTGAGADVDVYPFTTVDPNIGIVAVPDSRLERLGELLEPPKLTPARVKFVDIAGLVEGASRGEGLGNQFLARVREVDGIIHVLRCFEAGVSHVAGEVNPVRDLDIIRTEMAIADLETLKKHLQRLDSAIKRGDKTGIQEKEGLEKIEEYLSALELTALKDWLGEKDFQSENIRLLSTKPAIYIVNVPEEWASDPESATWVRGIRDEVEKDGPVIPMTIKLEGELSEMPRSEEAAFREEMNMKSQPLVRLIGEGAKLLELITFYTIKGDETRGWMVKDGTLIGTAAGKIHSDMEKGFIKAEVVSCDDLFSLGSMVKARDSGKVSVEGKGYPVKDGDVVLIHFKV